MAMKNAHVTTHRWWQDRSRKRHPFATEKRIGYLRINIHSTAHEPSTTTSQQFELRMLRWPPHVIPVARGQLKLLPRMQPWSSFHYDIQRCNRVKEPTTEFW